MFDSAWIYHFIEYKSHNKEKEVRPDPLMNIVNIGSSVKATAWQERKILELIIVDRMLDEILQSAKNVLYQIKRSVSDREAYDEVQKKPKLIEIIRRWVATLDEENKHGLYAFPRPRKKAPIHSFYFPDHAIIYRATKSVEYPGLSQELQVESSACVAKHKPRNMSYSSDEIRANTIKRFTTENPVLKKTHNSYFAKHNRD